MTFERYRERLDDTSFGVLATQGPEGRLDLVPCCFAVDDGPPDSTVTPELVTAIDHKPKTTTRLARLTNIERVPTASLLIDHRDPHDWGALWWVRAQGVARIAEPGTEGHRLAIEALAAKYRQYRERPPRGPAIRIDVERWAAWIP